MNVVFCLFGYLLTLFLFLIIRKNKHHLSFFQILGIGITIVSSEYVIFGQLLSLILKKNEPVIAGILMLGVAAVFLFTWDFKSIRLQKYYVGRQESAFGVTAVVLLILLVFYRKLYLSVDTILRALLWAASGFLFLSLIIDKVKKNNARVVGFIMSLFVMFGHPLTNVLFGNLELSVAMNWVLADLVLIRLYKMNRVSVWLCKAVIILEAVFFALGYPAGLLIMFVMVLPLFFFMCRDCTEEKELGTVIYIMGIAVFAIIAALVNVHITGGGLSGYYVYYRELKGAVFSNVWSDIGFMVFPILLYIYYRVDRKRNLKQLYWPIAGVVTYIIIIEESVIFHHPVYDGYNQLYLLWLLFMYIGVTGFVDTFEEFRTFLLAYFATVLCVFVLMLSGIEQTLHDMNVWYCVEVKADAYLKVFDWNYKALKNNSIPDPMQELIEYCSDLRTDDEVIVCMIENSEYRIESFYRQTGQEDKFRYMYMLQEKLLDAQAEQQTVWEEDIFGRYENVSYAMVEKNSDLYWYGIGMYSRLEVVYENDYGVIYRFS